MHRNYLLRKYFMKNMIKVIIIFNLIFYFFTILNKINIKMF